MTTFTYRNILKLKLSKQRCPFNWKPSSTMSSLSWSALCQSSTLAGLSFTLHCLQLPEGHNEGPFKRLICNNGSLYHSCAVGKIHRLSKRRFSNALTRTNTFCTVPCSTEHLKSAQTQQETKKEAAQKREEVHRQEVWARVSANRRTALQQHQHHHHNEFHQSNTNCCRLDKGGSHVQLVTLSEGQCHTGMMRERPDPHLSATGWIVIVIIRLLRKHKVQLAWSHRATRTSSVAHNLILLNILLSWSWKFSAEQQLTTCSKQTFPWTEMWWWRQDSVNGGCTLELNDIKKKRQTWSKPKQPIE